MASKLINRFFSSFGTKIFLLLILVGGIPSLASVIIYTRVTSFNQDLQIEAEKSIEEVSDVYRAWAAGVKSSHNAIRLIIRNDIERTIKMNNIRSIDELLENTKVKEEIKDRLERRIGELERLLEIDMVVASKPFLSVTDGELHANMNTDSMFANIRLEDLYEAPEGSQNRVPQYIQMDQEEDEPVVLDATGEEAVSADAATSLPSSLPEHPVRKRRFNAPIELTITVGYDRAITDAFEKLGERRGLHSSITTMESNKDTQLSSLYEKFFLIMISIVGFLVIAGGMIIVMPMSRKVTCLAKATQRVAEGDLETQVEVKGNDQLSELTRQFNAMTKDLKSAQENRGYIERMKAWQEVARKLAHEIKNPLTPMLLAMQQLDKKFDDYVDNPKKYRRLLDDVMEIMNEEAATLQKLVKEFSSFARLPVPERKPMKYFEFIASTIEQNPQFAEDTKRITLHEPSEALKAREAEIDKELMRRVIVNIVKNGIEAAQNAHIEPEIDVELREKINEKDGSSALWLLIIDNGPGLTAEQKEKIFNPYFTTKSDGTGLGLVIVRKIVQDHEGDISLHDRDDGQRGTQVDIVIR